MLYWLNRKALAMLSSSGKYGPRTLTEVSVYPSTYTVSVASGRFSMPANVYFRNFRILDM